MLLSADFYRRSGSAPVVGIPRNNPKVNTNRFMLMSFTVGTDMITLNRYKFTYFSNKRHN